MKELIRIIDISTSADNIANLHHLFFNIFPGQIHYLAGLHGSGKSALRNILCGQLLPQSGTLIINGNSVSSYTPQNARFEGIFSIDQNTSPMVSSLSVYENMEIFYSAKKVTRKLSMFDKKNALIRIKALLQEYNLSIDPMTKIQDMSSEDVVLLSILEAAYANARLVILNLSNLKLSYINNQKVFHIIKQMNSHGISFLLICDSFLNHPLLPGIISVIRKGHIIKQYDTSTVDANQINNILVPDQTSLLQKSNPASSGMIIGIMELYYSNYSLAEYFTKLGIISEYNQEDFANYEIKFIKANSLDCFCDNLSIGDNIALVRYPEVAEKTGYIDSSILRYLEKEFNSILVNFGAKPAKSIDTLSIAAKKILGIERWIMSGVKRLVIEDPLFGLDAQGQQILLRYLASLRSQDIRLIFVFYNISELQKICDTVHICNHGKIYSSVQTDSEINLEDVIQERSSNAHFPI